MEHWIDMLGRKMTEIPNDKAYGFVYCIMFDDDTFYIGKKNFYQKRKRNFGKKELSLITDKRKKTYEIVTKESNWKVYKSSNKATLDKINSGVPYFKRMLSIAYSSKELSYMEERSLFMNDVLVRDEFLNDNIAGRYFAKDMVDGR